MTHHPFTIAVLGAGAMGSRMAARLIEAGHAVRVWNRTLDRLEPLVAKGAVAAPTPADVARGADMVLSMVRDDAASHAVWEGPNGALDAMGSSAVAVECSTLTLRRARAFADASRARRIAAVDAPLAGSRPQAEAGALIFFAGGPKDALDRIHPALLAMGQSVHHAGSEVGAGMTVKLIVNALFGVQVAAVAECLAMARGLGLDPGAVAAILGETPILSPAAKGASAGMLAHAFAPQFPIELVVKDFAAVHDAAGEAGVAAPVAHAAASAYQAAADAGHADKNITAVASLYGP